MSTEWLPTVAELDEHDRQAWTSMQTSTAPQDAGAYAQPCTAIPAPIPDHLHAKPSEPMDMRLICWALISAAAAVFVVIRESQPQTPNAHAARAQCSTDASECAPLMLDMRSAP